MPVSVTEKTRSIESGSSEYECASRDSALKPGGAVELRKGE